MSETIRTTHNTFAILEARLDRVDPALVARIKANWKNRSQEVAFNVEPGTPDAKLIADALTNHGETGRTGTALDRIRAACLGQSAPEPTTGATDSGRVATTEPEPPKKEIEVVVAPSAPKQQEAAFTSFVSWREMVGSLAESMGVEADAPPKKGKKSS